jgi:hypothetical protein
LITVGIPAKSIALGCGGGAFFMPSLICLSGKTGFIGQSKNLFAKKPDAVTDYLEKLYFYSFPPNFFQN